MIPAETINQARDKSILGVAQECGAVLKKVGAEWNGPCPACGGRDRFWVDEAKNIFMCRMSGAAGDNMALLQHRHGCTFGEAVEMLTGARALPVSQRRPAPSPEEDNLYREKARRRAWAIWRDGQPIEIARGGHLVARYLAIRGIPMPDWRIKALREMPQLAYWHKPKGGDFIIVHKGPAMLAAITGPDGHFIGVHRTWLDLGRANGKAVITEPATGDVLDTKKVEGSQRGGRIVLREAPGHCTLGEGIETVLSWASLHGGQAALWCGINLDNIAGKAASQIPHPSLTIKDRLGRERKVKVGSQEPDLADGRCLHIPADDFERLTLLGDSDSDRYTTQAAMMRAKNRFILTGHDAEIDWAPDGHDWNDVLREATERKQARAVA